MNPSSSNPRSNEHNLQVRNYSIRVYPGHSSNATGDISGKALGYIILAGQGTQFNLQFLPDGSTLPRPVMNSQDNTVDLCMNWCQFEGVVKLLKEADSVQAYYSEDAEGSWADVEGQYVRPNSKP